MHPAPSIIFFTVASGLGFGMMFWLGIGEPTVIGFNAFLFYFVAYALAVGGLISSTFHLGNPQRALKAFTQWKTSWLSREGWLSVVTLSVIGIYAIAEIFFYTRLIPLGFLGAVLALASVFATSMIYGQLKTVPRWNQWTTPVVFLAMSLGGGALLADQILPAIVLIVVAAIAVILAWITGDKAFDRAGHTLSSATGLGTDGAVRAFEPPHTGTNYLMKEMVHVIGRKHATKLRVIGMILFALLPVVLLLLSANHVTGAIAAVSHIAGALTIRWLFFAEAEHVVGLYYGKR